MSMDRIEFDNDHTLCYDVGGMRVVGALAEELDRTDHPEQYRESNKPVINAVLEVAPNAGIIAVSSLADTNN